MEVRRWRRLLAKRLRRLFQDRCSRCNRSRSVRPQRGLRRYGRVLHPHRRLPRRRRLSLLRRWPLLVEYRPAKHPAHLPGPCPPQKPRPGLCRRPGPRLGAQPRARHLPLRRRWTILGARPLQERHHRRCRPFPRSEQPPDNVRRPLASPTLSLGIVQRRPRKRHLPFDRRRTYLGGCHPTPRPPRRHHGPHRHRRIPRQAWPALGHRRVRRRGPLPLRRLRRHLVPRQRQPRPPGQALVLPARLRRHQGPGLPLDSQLQDLEVHRRRRKLLRGHYPPRRQPRPLDRPSKPSPYDRRERRRRLRILQRRRDLVFHLQPDDRSVLSRHRRQPDSHIASTAPSRTTPPSVSLPATGRARSHGRNVASLGRAKAATSPSTPTTRMSSLLAPSAVLPAVAATSSATTMPPTRLASSPSGPSSTPASARRR